MRKKPHSAAFKFQVAIEAIRGEKTTAALAREFGVVSSQIFKWKQEVLNRGAEVFASKSPNAQHVAESEKLHATIGRLTVENDFLARFAGRRR